MKKLKSIKNKFIISLAVVFILTACSESFLDINTDPNNPSDGNLNLIMPAIQTAYPSAMLRQVNRATAAYVDQIQDYDFGRWQQVESDFNEAWKGFYSQALKDIEAIITKAAEEERLAYSGIAKLQKAYIYSILVDLWGDVPYSEAFASNNPSYDKGEEIYPQLFDLIDEGLAELNQPGSIFSDADMIYRGDKDKWIKMGNSLKLKMYLQTRLVDEAASAAGINSLINSGNYITSNQDDFQFQFGTGIAPQNAHPRWIDDYNEAGRSGYHSNHMFVKLLGGSERRPDDYEKLSPNVRYGVKDPRTRYYWFRQVTDMEEGSPSIPCEFNQIDCNYFYTGNGYLGRDRGDNSVGPADVAESTVWGVYPAGGLFDKDESQQVTVNDGTGAGIHPMITNFMMKFYLAEAALTMNAVDGDPWMYLEEGIRASIGKVMDFGDKTDPPPTEFKPTDEDIDTYVMAVKEKYDAADMEGKLEIIIDQFFVAIYGNGIEAYTSFRRTGYPILQPVVDNNEAGPFPLRLVYVVDELGSNKNMPSESLTTNPVFWDINN